MREHSDDSFSPLFRNTRSRLYQRKSSFEPDEPSLNNQRHPENSGQFWKARGNEEFKLRHYDKAIDCYSKAIEINPGQSQYYSNRSKCYQKQRLLDKSLKDAETACELEEQNIKAHYICGCILAEMGKKDSSKLGKAENRLKKALRLCRTRSAREFEEEISIKLFRLKKLAWFRQKQDELAQLECEKQLLQKALERNEISPERHGSISQRLNKQVEEARQEKEIPDHLICKITLMLMEDPVVSEEGFTYERKVLEEHYKLKGPVEPITRKQVTGKIYPNHALKQAIELFLKDSPWAFEEERGEDYQVIVFI